MDEFETVAVEACEAAGDYLVAEFERAETTAEYGPRDVKAEADRGAEDRALDVIAGAFPDHAVYAEERGERPGDAAYRWVLDPLDGTNNFCSGIPYFGTAVALLHEGDPVLGVVHDPLHDDTYVARRGEGATHDGTPASARSDVELDRGTVAFVVGLDAIEDDDLRARSEELEHSLAGQCKRVWESWAPALDWGLLARGDVEAVVAFHPDAIEQHAGWLLAEESDASTASQGELYVAAGDDATLAGLRDALF
ncbi:inositol monophosphatase family protein [Halomicrococcus gelatinilyticus]|uniref:inositol monophosphatase family protein n=1 Tax=Halomicrococcus gelatinilyticus TaxID=1702103 RepID=UPI002E155844